MQEKPIFFLDKTLFALNMLTITDRICCTVLIGGRPLLSSDILLSQIDGSIIFTDVIMTKAFAALQGWPKRWTPGSVNMR